MPRRTQVHVAPSDSLGLLPGQTVEHVRVSVFEVVSRLWVWLGSLGAFGLGHLWADTLAPILRGHVTPPVYRAINSCLPLVESSDVVVGMGGYVSVPAVAAAIRLRRPGPWSPAAG